MPSPKSAKTGTNIAKLSSTSEAAGPLLEEGAADDGVDATGPEDVDFDVAGKVPDEVNAVAETGESAGVEDGVGVGVEDLEGFGSSVGVPIQSVKGELMGVAVGEIHVKGEGAAAIPGRRNSPCAATGLQGARIRGASDPGITRLILHGKRGVRRDALRIVGDGISIGCVNAVPTALRAGVGTNEGGGCGDDQID